MLNNNTTDQKRKLLRRSTEDVTNFWFGRIDRESDYPMNKAAMWFANSPEVDALIREEFSETLERAMAGKLEMWKESFNGALALILVYDQLPRFAFRGKPEAFAMDERAQRICQWGIRRGLDKGLFPIERAFFYMPLVHAEDLELQKEGVLRFEALAKASPASLVIKLRNFYNDAIQCYEWIERFGRFPQRNAALGRQNTPEEQVFLQSLAQEDIPPQDDASEEQADMPQDDTAETQPSVPADPDKTTKS